VWGRVQPIMASNPAWRRGLQSMRPAGRVAELGSLGVMKPHAKSLTADWPKALAFLALLLLFLLMKPRTPLVFVVSFGVLLLATSLWAALSAFRERRGAAKTTAETLRYCFWVVATSLIIAFGWLLFCSFVASLFV